MKNLRLTLKVHLKFFKTSLVCKIVNQQISTLHALTYEALWPRIKFQILNW